MCGIIGYLGERDAVEVLLKGLKKLEYRGYDSAGIAVFNNERIDIIKKKGKIDNLSREVKEHKLSGFMGIGHTRWATHGIPSDENAHPHVDCSSRYIIVHNGIIENYEELKKVLLQKGHKFTSETDTEVIPHMMEDQATDDFEEAVRRVIKQLKGSFALVIMDSENPDKLVAVRKESPMVLGIGENENFIASDIPALLEYTKNLYVLEDYEFAVVTKNHIQIMDWEGNHIEKPIFVANWSADQITKQGYEDYMIKEIFEQPQAVRQTLACYLDEKGEISLPFSFSKEEVKKITRITIVACGTASYAGRIGEYVLEELTRIPCKVEVGSEYRYRHPVIDDNNLVIVLSQSGETADTLASMREAISSGAKVIGITNVKGSTVSRELQRVIHTQAGPEIAVASTKAYITQLISLYLIGLYIGKEAGTLSCEEYSKYVNMLKSVPQKIGQIIEGTDQIKNVAAKYYTYKNIFFIGRNTDYAISLEGSHKLKEISYIHAEAYEAGELKHGALALVTSEMPVVCISTITHVHDKMASNIKEVQARRAQVIFIKGKNIPSIDEVADEVVIPEIDDLLTPLLCIIPLQLLAYYIAKFLDCNVDQPRNLAKSVTVE